MRVRGVASEEVIMEVATGILGDVLPMVVSAVMFALLKPVSIAVVRRGGLGKDEKDIHALGDRVVGFVHAVISSVLATYFLTVPTFVLAEDGLVHGKYFIGKHPLYLLATSC